MLHKFRNFLDGLPFDNKLITSIVTYALTFLVARQGLDLDEVVIPPYTVAVLISLAAAAVVGYRTPNEATVLKAPETDGNPDPALLERSE